MQKIKKFLFQNTSAKQTIMKNAIWLFTGEIIGRLLKLVIVVFATRQLGVEGWGVFSYALAFVSFFYVLGDFGINTFITREMSKDKISKNEHFATSFILKISMLAIFFISSILIGPYLGKIKLSVNIITILSLLIFSDTIRSFILSINRSLEKMENEAFSNVLMNTITTLLGIILLSQNSKPISLAIAYCTGSIISSIFVFWSVRNEIKNIDWKFSKKSLQKIFDFSWPLIIIGLFSFIFSIDNIMLGQMKSTIDVGLYSAAGRLVAFTTIIPSLISTSVFPILSKNESNTEKSTMIFEKIMIIVFTIGIPLVVGGFILRQKIMLLVFGQSYVSGSLTLGILMFSILASFPNFVLSNMIFSKNLQKIFVRATAIGLILNLVLNIILIPKIGAVGAALSTTIAQLLIMTINWQLLKRYVSFSIIPKLWNIFYANIIIAMEILICVFLNFHIYTTIILTIVTYALTLKMLKEKTLEEILVVIKN